MEYTLKINAAGQLHGWQECHYYLNGSSIRDGQKFDKGNYCEWAGFVSVFQCGKNYSFMSSDWGTIELARDAAELFTTPTDYQFQYKKNEAGGWDILPNTEEALVG